jgi:hypothetical protein
MKKPYDTDDALWQMSSFYKTYMPDDPSLGGMLEIYKKILEYVEYEYRYVMANTSVPTAHTLYTMPYAKVEIADCIYSTHEAFLLRELEFEEVLNTLDRRGKYTTFEFHDENLRKAKVVSMVLKTTFIAKEPLKLYEHYFVRDNKLYLMPEFIMQHERVRTHLHALQIKIDERLLEKNWGTEYEVEVGSLVPKYKYRDYLEGLDYALMSNLTIKEISEGISKAIGWETFVIQDMYSKSLSPAKKKYYDNLWISPSKFIATLPEVLIKDKMRLNMLLFLLDETKQAGTDYSVFFDIVRTDPIPVTFKAGKIIHLPVLEKGKFEDTRKATFVKALMEPIAIGSSVQRTQIKTVEETLRHLDAAKVSKVSIGMAEHLWMGSSLLDKYDTSGHYSKNFFYDKNRFIHADRGFAFDSGLKFDQEIDKPAETVTIIEHAFPRIPRKAEVEVVPKVGYKVSFESSNDGTTDVEVYGIKSGTKEEVLLDKIPNVSIKERSEGVIKDVPSDIIGVRLRATVGGIANSMKTLEMLF